MRCLLPAATLFCLALTACGDTPDFDERYAEREQELAKERAALESELDRRMSEKPGLEEEGKVSQTSAADKNAGQE